MTNLVKPGVPGAEFSTPADVRLAEAKRSQLRQVFGSVDGERYFQAGLTMDQAARIHGLSGDALRRRVSELGLPAAVLPPERQETPEEKFMRTLGPNLGRAAAAMERENPLVCQQK